MARSTVAVLVGLVATVVGTALLLWAAFTCLPQLTTQASSAFYHPRDLFAIAIAFGLPGMVGGYLTARTARRSFGIHATVLSALFLLLFVLIHGPGFLRQAFLSIVSNGLFNTLDSINPPVATIGMVVWLPAIIFGGCIAWVPGFASADVGRTEREGLMSSMPRWIARVFGLAFFGIAYLGQHRWDILATAIFCGLVFEWYSIYGSRFWSASDNMLLALVTAATAIGIIVALIQKSVWPAFDVFYVAGIAFSGQYCLKPLTNALRRTYLRYRPRRSGAPGEPQE